MQRHIQFSIDNSEANLLGVYGRNSREDKSVRELRANSKFAQSIDRDSAPADSFGMKPIRTCPPFAHHLAVVGRHVDSLKGVLADMPMPEQGIASTIIAQSENTLTVLGAAWSCTNTCVGDAPEAPAKLLLN